MTERLDEYIGTSLLIGCALLLIMICGIMWTSIQTTNICLAHGYPEYRGTAILGQAYCVKRVNQTDVVVPLWYFDKR